MTIDAPSVIPQASEKVKGDARLGALIARSSSSGVRNWAQFRTPLELDRAIKAPNLASPLTFSDACGITDGASMVILCRADMASSFTDQPVLVVGSGGAPPDPTTSTG